MTSADAPTGPPDLVTALRDLAVMISEPTSIEGILQRVGDWCEEILPVDGVGVLLADEDGGLLVATASNPLGQIIERLEADLGQGPCSQSLATGQLIPVPDLTDVGDKYPEFVRGALEAGVHAIYAVPMTVRAQQIGALNIISRDPVVLTQEELAVAQLLADVTMSYIANSRMLEESSTLSAHLQRALDSRVVIEQAKGTLAERHDIPLDDAFERMRTEARSNSRRLADVARDVMTGELTL